MPSSNEKLSTEKQHKILELVSDGQLSKREIGRSLGIGESTVRKYAEKFGLDLFKTATSDGEPIVMLGRQIARLSEQNRDLRRLNKKADARGFGYDDFLEAFKKFAETEKLKPLTYFPTQIQKAKKLAPIPAIDPSHCEIACLALSDWHATETVRLADSNGINEYNTVIMANRLWDVLQTFKQIIQIHRAAYKVKKIWLPTLGDMISGSIHPEFISTNDATDQAAILLCARIYEMFLLELKTLGVEIQIDCVVGNHPRTTLKVPTKRLAHTNLDWLVYMVIQMLFRNDPQIKCNVHTSQLAIVEHFGYRYAIEHGIDWKNGHEEELEDRIRALLDDPIYRAATGLKGAAFDQIVIGNLHKPAFLERTIKNGSLIGQNELGQQWRLKPIKAQQLMWGISRNHVRTFQYQIDVTDVRSSKAENPFSEFAVEFMKDHGRYSLVA